ESLMTPRMRVLLVLLVLLAMPAQADWRHDCLEAARLCRQTRGASLVTTTTTTTMTVTTTTTTTLPYIANPSEHCATVYPPCVYIPDPRTGQLEYFCEYPDTLQCQPPCGPPVSTGSH